MKRFHVMRSEDLSGVSGVGKVAEGVEFWDGKVVIQWLTKLHSMGIYESMPVFEKIHGHEGRTVVVWVDKEDA